MFSDFKHKENKRIQRNPMATVVTAFYTMESKFPSEQYMKWIENFLQSIDCHLIFYTDSSMIPRLQEMRKPYAKKTRFIDLPRESWKAYTQYGKDFWQSQKQRDREAKIHSADLYAIWYEKKEFVLRAAELNPFGHTKYIWCDAGAFRYPEWLPSLRTFGSASYEIPEDKMVLLQVEPFNDDDLELFAIDQIGKFDDRNRIGGGIQAATAEIWKYWSALYDQKLQERHTKNMFVGKDQTIMAALALQNPNLVKLVDTNKTIKDHWFTLLFTFSLQKQVPVSVLIPLYNGIELLEETLDSVKKQTYANWTIHIGVNGWEPNSEVFQAASRFISPQIYVYDLHECKGKPATLNALINKTSDDWVALLDADDLWHPEKLELQVRFQQANPQFDVIGTGAKYFGDRDGSPRIPTGDITNEDFWKVNPLLHSSILIRRNAAVWNPDNRILEDYELWLRLRYQKRLRIFNVPYPLLFHRIHVKSHFNGNNSQALPDLIKRLKEEFNSAQ